MRKFAAMLITALLCAALLCGCAPGVVDVYKYEDAQLYTPGGTELDGGVSSLDIDWLSGEVLIERHAGQGIIVAEESDAPLSEELQLHWRLNDGRLCVRYIRSGAQSNGFLNKRLRVSLPEGLALEEIAVNGVSAAVRAESLAAGRVEINSVSGGVRLLDCAVADSLALRSTSGGLEARLTGRVETAALNSVSGPVSLEAGGVGAFEAHTTSGGITLSAGEAPASLEAGSVSGGVRLILPVGAGFTLRYGSVSGNLSSALPLSAAEGGLVCGDGVAAYSVSTTSGGLVIEARE